MLINVSRKSRGLLVGSGLGIPYLTEKQSSFKSLRSTQLSSSTTSQFTFVSEHTYIKIGYKFFFVGWWFHFYRRKSRLKWNKRPKVSSIWPTHYSFPSWATFIQKKICIITNFMTFWLFSLIYTLHEHAGPCTEIHFGSCGWHKSYFSSAEDRTSEAHS